jgi:hypothetical protein
MAFHLAGGKPEPVAKAGTAARGRAPRSQGDTVTSPASGAGSAPGPPGYVPIPQSAPGTQSVTGRSATPGATAGGGNRRLGLALLVIARPAPCPSRKRRRRSPRHRSPGLCSGMRTEPPSPQRPVRAGSASRRVITTLGEERRDDSGAQADDGASGGA